MNMQQEKEDMAEDSMDITIVYEDEDVVAIDKPSGMMVHHDGKNKGKDRTITDWFLEYCSSAAEVGEALVLENGDMIDRPGVVHRLDKDTSGVMVLAKDQESFLHLKKQFQDRNVKKEYRTFVFGTFRETRGVISRAIGRSAKDFRLRSAQRGARGTMRNAETAWERIAQSDMHTYIKVIPKTGRMHQIRVHLKAINRPVICDKLYAPKQGCALGFTRLALHAHKLTLILPNGSEQTFKTPLPKDFIDAEKLLK